MTTTRNSKKSKNRQLSNEEEELLALYKSRRHHQTEVEAKLSGSIHTSNRSVESVLSSLKTQLVQENEQRAKVKTHHPKHRLRRRHSGITSNADADVSLSTRESMPVGLHSMDSAVECDIGSHQSTHTLKRRKIMTQSDDISDSTSPPKSFSSSLEFSDTNISGHNSGSTPDSSSVHSSTSSVSSLSSRLNVFDNSGKLMRKCRHLHTKLLCNHPSKTSTLTPSSLFSTPRFEIDQLVEASDSLSALRSKLDPIVEAHGRDAWARHTASWNPSGQLVRSVRALAHVEMGTHSWTKFYEILSTISGVIPPSSYNERGVIMALCLCEAPGAFVCALNHYIRTKLNTNITFDWFASTLNPDCVANEGLWMICDDKFMRHTRAHWLFGSDGSGQLMNVNNIRSIWQHVGAHQVDIVTADGSLDSSQSPNQQERIAAPLIYCEVVAAIGALRIGGTLVLKMFTLLDGDSIALLYLLGTLFEHLHVIKPFSARHGNSELYVVALKFIGIDSSVLHRLCEYVRADFNTVNESLVPRETIPQAFIDAVVDTSLYFKRLQSNAISTSIDLWEHCEHSDRTDILRIRRQVAEQFVNEFNIQPLNTAARLVQKEYVDGARQPGQPFGPFPTTVPVRNKTRRSSPPPAPPPPPHPLKRLQIDSSYTSKLEHSQSPLRSGSFVTLPGSMSPQLLKSNVDDSSSMPSNTQSNDSMKNGIPSLPFAWVQPLMKWTNHLQDILSSLIGKSIEELACEKIGRPLRRQHLAEITSHRFMVSWMPDVSLSLLFVLQEGVFLMPLDKSHAPILIPDLSFPRRKTIGHVDRTILCGHMVVDKVAQTQIPRFLVTDLLAFDSHKLERENLALRLQIAKVELITPLKTRSAETGCHLRISVRVLPMFPLANVSNVMSILRTLTHQASGVALFCTAEANNSTVMVRSRNTDDDDDDDDGSGNNTRCSRFQYVLSQSHHNNAELNDTHIPEHELITFLQNQH